MRKEKEKEERFNPKVPPTAWTEPEQIQMIDFQFRSHIWVTGLQSLDHHLLPHRVRMGRKLQSEARTDNRL